MMKMAVVKVIEILAESENGWEDAAKNAIMEASKTVECINQINIENLKAVVKDNKIIKYRINAKVSFVVND
jgi:flavin-binding protein dodecin